MLNRRDKSQGFYLCAHVERLPFTDGCFEISSLWMPFTISTTNRRSGIVARPQTRRALVIHELNIARWPVKVIALAETLLLMRSRFFRADRLKQMFEAQENAKVTVDSDGFYIQLVAEKLP
jgi:hypothetical protein